MIPQCRDHIYCSHLVCEWILLVNMYTGFPYIRDKSEKGRANEKVVFQTWKALEVNNKVWKKYWSTTLFCYWTQAFSSKEIGFRSGQKQCLIKVVEISYGLKTQVLTGLHFEGLWWTTRHFVLCGRCITFWTVMWTWLYALVEFSVPFMPVYSHWIPQNMRSPSWAWWCSQNSQ